MKLPFWQSIPFKSGSRHFYKTIKFKKRTCRWSNTFNAIEVSIKSKIELAVSIKWRNSFPLISFGLFTAPTIPSAP